MATLIDSDNHCDNITVTSITIPLIVDFDNIRISAKIADANLLKTKNIKQETKKKKTNNFVQFFILNMRLKIN